MGGKVTCTLGEVKNRADFIIYWGGNPAECHPRHFTTYTLTQKGRFVPEGRKGRTMVLVDIRETMSSKAADLLYKANMPLVYGLSNVTCEAQRGAVALAEMIGGVVDSHTSL